MNELKKPSLKWCISQGLIERCIECEGAGIIGLDCHCKGYIENCGDCQGDGTALKQCQSCNGTGLHFDIDELIMSIAHDVTGAWSYKIPERIEEYIVRATIKLLALAEMENDYYDEIILLPVENHLNYAFKNAVFHLLSDMSQAVINTIFSIANHLNIDLIAEIKKEVE
jgi:DnaJ-class molecular chaperone